METINHIYVIVKSQKIKIQISRILLHSQSTSPNLKHYLINTKLTQLLYYKGKQFKRNLSLEKAVASSKYYHAPGSAI